MENSMTLKLFVDPKGKRVIFAEAGKYFVDFLFHILCLPVVSVYKLLREQEMVGNLYKSVTDWNYSSMLESKNIILEPKAPECTANIPLRLLQAGADCAYFYGCSNKSCASYNISDDRRGTCRVCYKPLDKKLYYCAYKRPANELGFVKDVTYMVTDDMIVRPLTATSTVDLLNRFNVESGEFKFKVKEVKVTKIEALELLKASMQSNNNVLTSIFLKDESKKIEDGIYFLARNRVNEDPFVKELVFESF